MTEQQDDPFAVVQYEKTPALKFPTPGTEYTGTVTDAPKLVQKHVYTPNGDGPLAWWDREETQPKMAVVINMTVNDEKVSLWADKPGALFRAIGDAQTAAGSRVLPGGKLWVKFTHKAPSPNGYLQNQFDVKYKAGTPAAADPWADGDTHVKAVADYAAKTATADAPPF
jgi:hypothetical protein